MPTDNPKVSAYVPQVVYDRVKAFQEERGLSMSQAATVIFAEYFGLQETTERSTVGGVTLDAFQALEKRVAKLEGETRESWVARKPPKPRSKRQTEAVSQLEIYGV